MNWESRPESVEFMEGGEDQTTERSTVVARNDTQMRRRLDDGKNVHGPGQERKARGSEVRLTADTEITEEEERDCNL